MNRQKEKVTIPTIIRTACLMLALVNQGLSIAGCSPLPIEDEAVGQIVSLAATVIASLAAWWKNNSFTRKAIQADRTFKEG